MSPGVLVLGILAVLFGLIGAYGAKKYIEGQSRPTETSQPTEELISVPLAVRDLPEGRTITAGDITTAQLTAKQIREMALPDSFMDRVPQIVGRTLQRGVTRGQPFEPAVFYPDGVGPRVAERLDTGERAVTIPFEGSASEAGLITPGAYVDVLFRTFADTARMAPETTVTLLDNVKVLAVDREISEGAVGPEGGAPAGRNVTLAVSPVQARALKVVEDNGSLMLVLRSERDMPSASESGPSTLHELLGLHPAEPPLRTEIYRRGRLTTVVHGPEGPQYFQQATAPYGLPVRERQQASDTQRVPHSPASVTQPTTRGPQAPSPAGSAAKQAPIRR
jgi:pilus assembly protein CpaB